MLLRGSKMSQKSLLPTPGDVLTLKIFSWRKIGIWSAFRHFLPNFFGFYCFEVFAVSDAIICITLGVMQRDVKNQEKSSKCLILKREISK